MEPNLDSSCIKNYEYYKLHAYDVQYLDLLKKLSYSIH